MDKNTFNLIYDGTHEKIKEPRRVRKRDKLAAVFMVLKLGNSFEAIGALYDVCSTTMSRWFNECIQQTADLGLGAINWWSRDQVQATMPDECRYII